MTQTEGTVIYIEKENTTEAEFMSRNFVNAEIRNKAYLNALGAELVAKYLQSEGFDTANTHNIHSISKILEDIDISDILLPNIHIDVRVIFDKNQIFIPKSHFDLQIVPDIYAVVKIDEKFEKAELLGYFKPSTIDKKNQNSDYYFVTEKDLSTPNTLTKFIKDFPGKTFQPLSDEDFFRGRELSVSLSDHNITIDEKRELLQLLLMDAELRESVIEFDNFETLSYSAAPELANLITELAIPAIETETEETSTDEQDLEEELIIAEDEENEISEEELVIDDIEPIESDLEESIEEETETEVETLESNLEETIENEPETNIAIDVDVTEEVLESEPETPEIENTIEPHDDIAMETPILDMENVDLGDDMLGGDLLDENITLPEATLQEEPVIEAKETIEQVAEPAVEEVVETPILETPLQETSLPEPELMPLPEMNLSVDAILDQTIASIGQNVVEKAVETTGTIVTGLEAATAAGTVISDVANAIEDTIETGTSTELETQEEKTEEEQQQEPEKETEEAEESNEITDEINSEASDEAIKLASVAGDMIDNVVDKNIQQQQKRLDRIDYEKTDITPDTKEIPEHIQALGTLSASKHEANLEAEQSGAFDSPKDISELNAVETYEEEVFEQETIDIESMDTVETEEFTENTNEIVNLSDISDIDSPTKPLKDIENLSEPDIEGMDLPDLSSYTINDDGTSSIDNFDINLDLGNESHEEHLVDMGMKMNLNEISLDDNDPFNIEEIEENPEHLNELPPMNDFSSDNFAENTPAEDIELPEEAKEETEIIDSDFDEISLDDFEEFAAANDEEITETVEQAKQETEMEISDLQEEESTEQDWLEDTNYDNMEDINPEITQETIDEEELIFEPETDNETQKVTAVANSIAISDRNFKVGEIPIDINSAQQTEYAADESLESIYDPNSKLPGEGLLQAPGRMGATKQNKSGLGIGLGIAGVFITLALVGAIGFGAAKLFKAPNQETPQPITDDNLPITDNNINDNNTLNVDPNNVVNMDENTNALASTSQTASQPKPAAKTTQAPAAGKKMAPTSFIEIKKLTWEVPDYISYNPQFKQYFQSIGKSLKLSLGSDLLLATDPIFSNQVRVSVTFEKDGTFKTSQIIVSSGSTQVDKIVLQTVNETLKALKAPHSVGNDENTTVILKLYF